MKRFLVVLSIICLYGCEIPVPPPTADQKMNRQQEQMSAQANMEAGMPGIKNFTVKKTMRTVLEKQDEANLVTYGYVYSQMRGKFTYIGTGYGYPIPYSTQYTSPQRPARSRETEIQGNIILPQADPTGLYSPASADATWWLMLNDKNTVEVIYFEEKLNVFPFKLPSRLVE